VYRILFLGLLCGDTQFGDVAVDGRIIIKSILMNSVVS
jgi:hypothetical protein